jgi:VanZ family protein
MRPLRRLPLYAALGLLYTAFIIWGTLTPHPPAPPDLPFIDKWEHFTAYGLMMGWWGQLLEAPAARWRACLACAALGGVLELLQGLGGVRQMELADALANAVGAGLGWYLTRGAGGRLLARLEAQA